MSGPDRLKAELNRDPNFLRSFRESCEEELEIELEKLGVARVSQVYCLIRLTSFNMIIKRKKLAKLLCVESLQEDDLITRLSTLCRPTSLLPVVCLLI
jgi:hypothetical protein